MIEEKDGLRLRGQSAVEVFDIRAASSPGNVRAYVSFRLGGVTIHGAKIVQQSGQAAWLAMPDRQWSDQTGKTRYSQVVELSPSLRALATEHVLRAWTERK